MFDPQSTTQQTSFEANDFAQKRHESSDSLPGVREIRIVLGAAFFSWLALALLTFRVTDPSLFHMLVPAGSITNWCGAFGAHAAALLYVLFGPAAWGALLFAVFIIPRPQESYVQLIGRGLAALTAMVSVGALFAAANMPMLGPITGGLLGSYALGAEQWVGVAGCIIGYSMMLVFSMLRYARVSIPVATQKVMAVVNMVARMIYAVLAFMARWLWASSARLWRRKDADGQGSDGGFDGSGSDATPVFETEAPAPAANQWSQENANTYTIDEQFVGDIEQNIEDTPEQKNDDEWHSFMPTEEDGETATDEASFSAAESTEHSIDGPPSMDPRVAEATAEDDFFGVAEDDEDDDADDDEEALSFAPDEFAAEEKSDDAVWGAHATDDGSEKYFDIDGDEATPAAPEAVVESEDVEDEATEEPVKKVEIEDDGFDFDAAETTSLDDEEEEPPAYEPPPVYTLPDQSLFSPSQGSHADNEAFMHACQERGRVLEEKLAHFGISGRVVGIHPGPVITLFEYEPDVGSKVSKIVALEDDLAMSLKALSIRIIAPVPGKCVVGFEIANEERSSVLFADVISDGGLLNAGHALPIALGSDIVGKPVIADLATMPHLLVAGATGAGKSVGMNVMLVSMLASMSPDKVRMILIDPKRLEFAPYADVPHLLFPIVTSPYEVAPVLKWVVQEMELRYEIMAQAGVRNIADYHKLDPEDCFRIEHNVGLRVHGMPYMVIMIDELADLMMVASKEIETLIARIAQMARAAGIHMIVATQRPSVDVVTGLIKANFPSRIAFRVSTKIDSRTIIDGPGAEKLLGKGDMLYLSPSNNGLQRLHGAYVTDQEVDRLTTFLKEQREVDYFSLRQVVAQHSEQKDEDTDPLYDEICQDLREVEEISISSLQRKYRVGFNRSARLIEMLERDGYIAPAQGSRPRRVLVKD